MLNFRFLTPFKIHSNNIFNSISLITPVNSLQCVKDFEKKINQKVEFERFSGDLF